MTALTHEPSPQRGAQILINSARNSVSDMPRSEMVDDLVRILMRYANGSYEAETALSYVAAVATVGLERALANIATRAADGETKVLGQPCT